MGTWRVCRLLQSWLTVHPKGEATGTGFEKHCSPECKSSNHLISHNSSLLAKKKSPFSLLLYSLFQTNNCALVSRGLKRELRRGTCTACSLEGFVIHQYIVSMRSSQHKKLTSFCHRYYEARHSAPSFVCYTSMYCIPGCDPWCNTSAR